MGSQQGGYRELLRARKSCLCSRRAALLLFPQSPLQLKGCLGSLCTFSSYFSILIYMAGPSSFGMAQANVLDM